MAANVKAGNRYRNNLFEITVRRVARDGSWADIEVYQLSTGAMWSKRQPLVTPFTPPKHFGTLRVDGDKA